MILRNIIQYCRSNVFQSMYLPVELILNLLRGPLVFLATIDRHVVFRHTMVGGHHFHQRKITIGLVIICIMLVFLHIYFLLSQGRTRCQLRFYRSFTIYKTIQIRCD